MSVVVKGWETLMRIFEASPSIIEHTCAFTGHRPSKLPWKYDEKAPGCIALKKQLENIVSDMAEHGMVHFLSGMAIGTDLWAADAVLATRRIHPNVKLHCVLPFCGQADKWSKSYKDHYNEILEQSDAIIRVHRDYKEGCLLERNYFMVNAASTVVAIFDGHYRSGTGATVRYAYKMRKKLLIINPVELTVSCYNK